jgi:hypothetical protein
MTSLGEVYNGESGRHPVSNRRLTVGTALFSVGVLLVVAGIVVATTDVLRGAGVGLFEAREYAGILAGVGVPAVFLGVLTVLPASRTTRAAAVVGSAVAVLGVALFTHAYPCRWSGATCDPGLPNLTLPTVGLYFVGTLVTFWCLFVGVANFKTRNDPGGTVRMEVTRQGETKVVEVEKSRGLGGIGFLGSTPDGDVQTQTRSTAEPSVTADGGATTNDIASPLDEPRTGGDGSDADADPGDVYCGNCAHFEYVRTGGGIEPYCGHHEETMGDMDACDQWTRR